MTDRSDVTHAPRRMKLVATDSGLGGLSVVAELVARLREARCCDVADIVFFNARPDANGFNGMDPQRQLRVFDRALRCMHQRHQPEAVLIACHTLSAIYPRTGFARRPPTEVHGIVEDSVRLIREHLHPARDRRAILLATPITHDAGIYPRSLTREGVPESQLVPIAARGLAGAIERGIDAPDTKRIIAEAARCVRERTDDPARPHVLCLLCTHFPYAREAIRAAIEAQGVHVTDVLDPNAHMAEAFLASRRLQSQTSRPPQMRVRVEAQVIHDEATKRTIAPLLEPRCALTAAALRDDAHRPGLFAID